MKAQWPRSKALRVLIPVLEYANGKNASEHRNRPTAE